jgi:cytochrome P450 family 142 subfamily A polypeptide 1
MSEPTSSSDDSPYLRTLRPGTRQAAHPTRDDVRLLSPDFYADPHERFAWLRAHAPVYWDDATGIWGVARYADVMAVSRDWQTFCSGEGSRPDSSVPSMINMDPPQHVLRRRIISAGFTPRRVQDHEPYLRRKVRELLGRVAARGACDFVREIATPLPMYMIGELMGLPEADHATLLHWSDLFATGNAELAGEVRQAVVDYAEYITRVIGARRGGAGEDLVSLAVNAVVDGERLSENDLIFETMLVLVGGDETTRHVISGGLAALLEHPEQMQKLRANPGLVPSAVEEMLRWVTPIQNMNRTATRDAELGGQRIRAGDRLLLLYPSGNRDTSEFAEPDRFDITRDPNRHVAFGGFGTHHCLGATLARLELKVLFEELLRRFPDVELATDEPLPLRPSNFIVGLERMPVRFTPGG